MRQSDRIIKLLNFAVKYDSRVPTKFKMSSWQRFAHCECFLFYTVFTVRRYALHGLSYRNSVCRVARYPVFQGSSRISAPISRLPERSYPADEISRISLTTCQSPVTTHGDTLYGPCMVATAYMTTMQFMRNSTVYYIIQHTVLLLLIRQTSVVPHSEHWTQWTSGVNPNLFWAAGEREKTNRPKGEAGRIETSKFTTEMPYNV